LGIVDVVAKILSCHTHLRIHVISGVYLSRWSSIVCNVINIFIFRVGCGLFLRNNRFLRTLRYAISIFWLFHAHAVHLEHLLIWTSTAKPLNHVFSSAFFPVLPPFGESRRKHTYLLDPFDLLFPLHLPAPNVVGRLATLESFKHSFVFY
jgi:hypothetical protein